MLQENHVQSDHAEAPWEGLTQTEPTPQPGRSKIVMTERWITPEIAQELYENRSEFNRVVDPILVKQYSNDMALGNWRDTGETISLNPEGRVNGGQTRLCAVVDCGISRWIHFAQGTTDEDAILALNAGKLNTRRHILNSFGYPNYSELAAIEGKMYVHDVLKRLPFHRANGRQGHYKHSHAEMLTYVKGHFDEMIAVIPHAAKVKGLLSISIAGFLFAIFAREDRPEAEKFFANLGDPSMLPANDPIIQARRLMEPHKHTRIPHTHGEKAFRVLCAWYATRNNLPGVKAVQLLLSKHGMGHFTTLLTKHS